jgi:ribose 1,5-bisphosphokinase
VDVAHSGRLVLVVGPSGAGKDTLIGYCRERLAGDPSVIFPRRVVTREEGAHEDHDTLDHRGFDDEVTRGAYALSWRAHGLGYGVPATIVADLAQGRSVVVNVSRMVVAEARQRFRPLSVALVTAPPDVLAARLSARGRENAADVDSRIARAPATVAGEDVVVIDNSGPVEEAGDRLLAVIRGSGD